MNAITRIPERPTVRVTRLAQQHITAHPAELCAVRVEIHGVRMDVSLDDSGAVIPPRGVSLSYQDLGEIEAAAQSAYLNTMIARFATQRERRQVANAWQAANDARL